MSVKYRKDLKPGDTLICMQKHRSDNKKTISKKAEIEEGHEFVIDSITKEGDVEYHSKTKIPHQTYLSGIRGEDIFYGKFHITSHMSTYFILPKRENNLKILLDE
jgi:hypothetical protein